MRSIPTVPLTIAELQLSSPLPSPSRHSVLNNNNNNNNSDFHHSHHTLLNTINNSSSSSSTNNSTLDPASISTLTLPPIQFDLFHTRNTDLYPLANLSTPKSLKKFYFSVDGKQGLFEELGVRILIFVY